MRNPRILSSPLFILSVVVLLLNDFLFKHQFGNLLTGKLSDLAGLFAFSLFFFAFLKQKHWHYTGIIIAALFVLWKSPLSSGFIEWWNGFSALTLYRVVDYSDLVALGMIPLAYHYSRWQEGKPAFGMSPVLPALLAVFAFSATSYRSDIQINKRYDFAMSADSLKSRLSHNDSAHCVRSTVNPGIVPDTIELNVNSRLCGTSFAARVIVDGDSVNSSLYFRMAIFGNCPDNPKDTALIIRDFEKNVVRQVRYTN